jgi:hypothetical protein
MSLSRLDYLADTLSDLSFDEKIQLVSELGLYAAYCPGCNCTLGSPECHPLPEINADEIQNTGCPTPCPIDAEEDPR